jgi:hypothetical protein
MDSRTRSAGAAGHKRQSRGLKQAPPHGMQPHVQQSQQAPADDGDEGVLPPDLNAPGARVDRGRRPSHRQRQRRRDFQPALSVGNLVRAPAQVSTVGEMIAEEVSRLGRLSTALTEQMNLAPSAHECVVTIMTDLSVNSSPDAALLLAMSTYATTRRPVIVVQVLAAPVSGVSSLSILYCGTPNTRESHNRVLRQDVIDDRDPIGACHAACPTAAAALARGFWGVTAVVRGYQMRDSVIESVCPCRWDLRLPQWRGERVGQMSSHSRTLTSHHIRLLATVRTTANQCRPYHHRRCQCDRETPCCPWVTPAPERRGSSSASTPSELESVDADDWTSDHEDSRNEV